MVQTLVRLAETGLLAPLDQMAQKMVLDSAKRVSVVTAVSPRALVDVGYVIYESSRLIRRLAELYGGRPGTLGLFRLARRVVAHLAVTGSIAVGDSLIQQLVGHGLAAKLSARLGEGVINGLMTARVGIAAMDIVRPLPFVAVRRPGIGDFMSELTRIGGKPAPDA
jgi:putative membrane protein